MKSVKPPSRVSELLDLAESLRQQERHIEAAKAIEDCLGQSPRQPRALLLRARLQYQQGRLTEAKESLRALGSVLGGDEALAAMRAALEQLEQRRNAQTDTAFATETMARLLAEQGYLLEALDLYRRLFLASAGEKRLWEKILSLRERLGQEGSRDARKEDIARQLEMLDRWMQEQRGGE